MDFGPIRARAGSYLNFKSLYIIILLLTDVNVDDLLKSWEASLSLHGGKFTFISLFGCKFS